MSSPLVFSGAAQAVDLTDAIRASLQTNPDIGIVVESRRAVEAEVEQAKSGYWPSVDFSASQGIDLTNSRTTRGRVQEPDSGDTVVLGAFGSSLTLTQPLFDGYATDNEVRRQEARLVSASRRVRESSEFIALDAVQAYLESLRQRELTDLAADNVEVHRQTLELVEAKAAAGAATVADIQQGQSRLAAAEATLTEAEARLRDADATYTRIVGEIPKDLDRPRAPSWALPRTLEEAIELALENNPTISVLRADLEASRAEYDGSKSSFYPTVDLELSANYDDNQDGTVGADYGASALVVLNYNLFRGWQDSNTRKEFLSRVAEARQVLNRTIRLTEEEMRLAWNAVSSAGDRVAAQTREAEANDTVRETYRQQFALGGRSLLELLDAENELFLTKGALIGSEFEQIFSVFRILATTGTLLATMDVPSIVESQTPVDPITPADIDQELRLLELERQAEAEALTASSDPLGAENQGLGLPNVLNDAAPVLNPQIFDPNALVAPTDVLDPSSLLDPAQVLNPNDLINDGSTLDPSTLIEPDPAPDSSSDSSAIDSSGVLDPSQLLNPNPDQGEGALAVPQDGEVLDPTSLLGPNVPSENSSGEEAVFDPNDLLNPDALLDPDADLSTGQSSPSETGPVAPLGTSEEAFDPNALLGPAQTEIPSLSTAPASRAADGFDVLTPDLSTPPLTVDPLNPYIPDNPNGLEMEDPLFDEVTTDNSNSGGSLGDLRALEQSGALTLPGETAPLHRGDPSANGDIVWGAQNPDLAGRFDRSGAMISGHNAAGIALINPETSLPVDQMMAAGGVPSRVAPGLSEITSDGSLAVSGSQVSATSALPSLPTPLSALPWGAGLADE